MERAGAEPSESLQVITRSIPLIPFKTVLWKEGVIPSHDSVTVHLCHDGGRRYAHAPLIAFYQTLLGHIHRHPMDAVNQKKGGRWGKAQDGPFHRLKGRLQDIVVIDIGVRDDRNTDGQ